MFLWNMLIAKERMDKKWFKGKKITVMGIGLNGGGVGTIKFLSSCGAKIIATDLKNREQLQMSLDQLKGIKDLEFVLGQHRMEDFTSVDMVVKGPSVPWDEKHIVAALEKKIPVEMDSSLFFKLCKNKVIGVSGTKGKTTTASLIAAMLKQAEKNVLSVGIGQVSVLDRLNEVEDETVIVFELSSWRLSALGRAGLSPHIAVLTNIMRDHLNYYKTMERYAKDKEYIFANQKASDWLIINNEDERLRKMASIAKSRLVRCAKEELRNGEAVFMSEGELKINDGNDINSIVKIADISLQGEHNKTDCMLAAGAAFAAGVSLVDIAKVLKSFSGVPHRLEFVREFNGVKYYNDTAATIPDAAVLSLRSFDCPVVLIAGGTDKDLEFEFLAKEIVARTKGIVLLVGTATEKLLAQLKKIKGEEYVKEIAIANSMEEAVQVARRASQDGDAILLSPGAASFGIFENEFDRGDKFKKIVKDLK